MRAKVKTNQEYRKEILLEITEYLNNKEYDDLIITADWNEHILSDEIQRFYRLLGLRDIHTTVNNINQPLDSTHINGSKCIDSIAMTVNLIDFVEESILLESCEIIPSNHHGYIIDLNLEDYFEESLTVIDKMSFQMINPSRKSHRQKYKEELEKIIDIMNFETTFNQHYNRYATKEIIDQVDRDITHILNSARKKVAGRKRSIPYSKEKSQKIVSLRDWKGRLGLLQGRRVSHEAIVKRRDFLAIEYKDELTIDQVKEKIAEAESE